MDQASYFASLDAIQEYFGSEYACMIAWMKTYLVFLEVPFFIGLIFTFGKMGTAPGAGYGAVIPAAVLTIMFLFVIDMCHSFCEFLYISDMHVLVKVRK